LVDPSNGHYTTFIRSPTGGAADPALTAHGVDQANELAVRLLTADPPIERVYSSMYYRCLQTVEPFVRKTQEAAAAAAAGAGAHAPATPNAPVAAAPSEVSRPPLLRVKGETGLGEWYGSADFEHPAPASLERLGPLFPGMLDPEYGPVVTPNRMGEGIDELHDRVAAAMEALIAQCDRDGVRAVLLCSHAAVVIALGRVLTGQMPDLVDTEDFKCFTCGLSAYRRRAAGVATGARDGVVTQATAAGDVDHDRKIGLAWRGGQGVSGGWECELNSDCGHLRSGEERGWSVAAASLPA